MAIKYTVAVHRDEALELCAYTPLYICTLMYCIRISFLPGNRCQIEYTCYNRYVFARQVHFGVLGRHLKAEPSEKAQKEEGCSSPHSIRRGLG